MPVLINVHEAKTRFSQLLEQAHAGQEIILAKAGKPYARMVPLEVESPRRKPGRLKIVVGVAFFEPLPNDELAGWGEALE
jgi:prevent-host-death family protein